MKLSYKILFSLTTIICLIVLSSCGTNLDLDSLHSRLESFDATLSLLDEVAIEDLGFNNLTDLSSSSESNSSIIRLNEITVIDKIEAIKNYINTIRDKQTLINSTKVQIKEDLKDLKATIKAFKESNHQLTDEEKTLIKNYIAEVKQLNTDVKNTLGKVYRKIFNLRGRYFRRNLDLIVSTFNEVNNTIDIRVNRVGRISEIINEVNQVLQNRMK